MITRVMYQRVDPEVYSIQQAGAFYYHHNLMNIDSSIMNEHIKHEEEQMILRNKLIGVEMKQHPELKRIESAMLAISSISNDVIIIAEV